MGRTTKCVYCEAHLTNFDEVLDHRCPGTPAPSFTSKLDEILSILKEMRSEKSHSDTSEPRPRKLLRRIHLLEKRMETVESKVLGPAMAYAEETEPPAMQDRWIAKTPWQLYPDTPAWMSVPEIYGRFISLENRIEELEAKVEYLHGHVRYQSFSPSTNPWTP